MEKKKSNKNLPNLNKSKVFVFYLYSDTFIVSVGSSFTSTGLLTESDSRFTIGSFASTGASMVGGFGAVSLSNGLADRLFSDIFGIFGILGSPDISGCSFFAKQFGTFDPNNE